jgi:hypothetical protein
MGLSPSQVFSQQRLQMAFMVALASVGQHLGQSMESVNDYAL